jgi:hypothetical protein
MELSKYKKLKSNPSIILGDYCSLNDLKPVENLEIGMDFRNPIYRREVFLRFYEFHLKYYSHPGGVYFMMPFLADKFNWTQEQKYWYAFINGSTQNVCSSWVVFSTFPYFESLNLDEFEKWHWENWRNLQYDIDRRYVKGHLSEQVQNYKKLLGGKTQVEFFNDLCNTGDKYGNFWNVWNKIFKDFFMYGRLSTFSYMEYLKIMGLNIDCPDLFMEDLDGSKSHRNGMCKVLGRDDLDWFKDNEQFPGHSKEVVMWLEDEAEELLIESKIRFQGKPFYKDVNYFTLESTLCCYKSWHRVNRRYPNIYMDMMFERIKYAESKGWSSQGIDFDIFWEARRQVLPEHLRIEDNPKDPTFKKGNLHPEKQNHYRLTGQIPMLDLDWECFKNDFNDKYYD